MEPIKPIAWRRRQFHKLTGEMLNKIAQALFEKLSVENSQNTSAAVANQQRSASSPKVGSGAAPAFDLAAAQRPKAHSPESEWRQQNVAQMERLKQLIALSAASRTPPALTGERSDEA